MHFYRTKNKRKKEGLPITHDKDEEELKAMLGRHKSDKRNWGISYRKGKREQCRFK